MATFCYDVSRAIGDLIRCRNPSCPRTTVKTFSLRGIKDSPPYFHDGRLPTLEDTVEFFNLILETRLTRDEKQDLVAFLRCL